MGGGVHDSYTFQCGLVGSFTSSWHRHQIEGTNGFYCLIRKTLASGVNGIAKVPKRKVFTEVGLEPSNVRSPVDSLTHSATAPPSCMARSILAMQQLRNDYSLTYSPLSIARYSFIGGIQLSRLRRQWRE